MQANIRKRVEFEYAAMHDNLTGLKNRKALIHHLEKRLQAAPVSQERLAVLFIDLDGFKRNSDLVARLGGDEFVIVCNDLRKSDDVQLLITRIQEAIRNPIELDHHPLHVGASTGLALNPACVGRSTDPAPPARSALR